MLSVNKLIWLEFVFFLLHTDTLGFEEELFLFGSLHSQLYRKVGTKFLVDRTKWERSEFLYSTTSIKIRTEFFLNKTVCKLLPNHIRRGIFPLPSQTLNALQCFTPDVYASLYVIDFHWNSLPTTSFYRVPKCCFLNFNAIKSNALKNWLKKYHYRN